MKSIKRILPRLFRDRSGMALIEFAVVGPLLITMLVGLVDVSSAVIAYMKVVDAADTVGGLITQQSSVATSDFDNLYTAAQLVMTPSPAAPLKLVIASVVFDATTGAPSVAWQVTRGGTADDRVLPMTDAAAAAAGLGGPGESIIEAQATYQFTSPLQQILPFPITLTSRVFYKPRLTPQITCSAPCI